jgi:hypothetical protein
MDQGSPPHSVAWAGDVESERYVWASVRWRGGKGGGGEAEVSAVGGELGRRRARGAGRHER